MIAISSPIYFIRHGQTDWNAEGRFQGQRDIPLNDTGRQQASRNGTLLGQLIEGRVNEFSFVSSPLGRTRETMERVRAALSLDPLSYATDASLVELSFGDWEGRTFLELERLYPQDMERRASDKWNFIPPGEQAESYEILSWRVSGWLAKVSGPSICVTHGGVIRSIFKLTGASTETEAADQDIHQDRILRYENGTLTWIAA